jgi:HlyD family secretion protein
VNRKKLFIAGGVVLAAAALVAANLTLRKDTGKEVTAEAIKRRDLEAIVSASGKIEARTSVEISADTVGRVMNLAVEEGQRVTKGQFLMQIDPRNQQSRVQQTEASLGAARSQLEQFRLAIVSARENLSLARENLRRQKELWAQQLTTREALDRADNEVKVREAQLREAEQQLSTQDQRIREGQALLSSARYELSKVRIESPISGLIVRRAIEEGETVVVGTMNNPGTVLLTIADMSIIEAEVEVDETDIPTVQLGQKAKITIDALEDKTFTGKVTEIGNSPIQTTQGQGQAAAGQQATNFKVVITLDGGEIPDIRPGFTCTAEITTATRGKSIAVPIQAMAVRELVFDAKGNVVREPVEENSRRRRRSVEPTASAEELKPGQTRKETEGVFVVRGGKAVFVPVKTGIAGEKYFEVLSGLKEGDQVITGPFNSVRDLKDGDLVKVEASRTRRTT